jgi:hypothetical protein
MRYKLVKDCAIHKSQLGYNYILIDTLTGNSTTLLKSPEQCFKSLNENGFWFKSKEILEQVRSKTYWDIVEEYKTTDEIIERHPECFIWKNNRK